MTRSVSLVPPASGPVTPRPAAAAPLKPQPTGPLVFFGDASFDFQSNALRRGGPTRFLSDDVSRVMEALTAADEMRITPETLWRRAFGSVEPFDGQWLGEIIHLANSEIVECDLEIVVKDFVIVLTDVTPKVFLGRRA